VKFTYLKNYPWDNQVDGSNPLRMYQPIRMQGQHLDEESGLHYNRHRYYDPTLGRYITQDPIGLLGGWNLYAYTTNPSQQTDPLGLASWDIFTNKQVKAPKSPSLSESSRPDGRPWGAGCGDAGTDKLVPDGMYGANFTEACEIHDACYETLGKDKMTCDAELGKDIVLACDEELGILEGIPDDENILYSCRATSGIYQSAVEKFGGPAYEAAQRLVK
jgi:RHS repeat-associated protein